MGSNKKSSVGACKSYCMNFNSFKIVDSNWVWQFMNVVLVAMEKVVVLAIVVT